MGSSVPGSRRPHDGDVIIIEIEGTARTPLCWTS